MVNSNFKYYHPDITAQKEIKKKYEFEYIDSISNIELKRNREEEIRTLSDNFTLIFDIKYFESIFAL